MRGVALALGLVGAVVLFQGVAWMGGATSGKRRRWQGAVLAPLALAMVLVALLLYGVPGFFA